MIFVAVEEKI